MQTQRQLLHHSHTRATVDPPGLHPGTLYQGNFEEWFANKSAALKRHGANITDVFAPKNQGRQWAFALQTGTDIKTFFTSDINPRIWQRVPKALLSNQRDTLTALRNVASPFRLMDLPPELRSKIFEFSIGDCTCADAENLYFRFGRVWARTAGFASDARLIFSVNRCRRCIESAYHMTNGSFLPPLTRPSRQLRVETLSLAWSTVDLCVFRKKSVDRIRDLGFYRTALPMVGFESLQRVTLVILEFSMSFDQTEQFNSFAFTKTCGLRIVQGFNATDGYVCWGAPGQKVDCRLPGAQYQAGYGPLTCATLGESTLSCSTQEGASVNNACTVNGDELMWVLDFGAIEGCTQFFLSRRRRKLCHEGGGSRTGSDEGR